MPLAVGYIQLEDASKARDRLKRAVYLRPDDLHALALLAMVTIKLRDFQSAEKELRKIVELRPHNLSILLHAANQFSIADIRQDAIYLYQRASELSPTEGWIHTRLADLFYQQNDLKKAPGRRISQGS